MAVKPSYRLFDITLARRTQVSASLVRFTFTGPEVGQMATYAPDQRVKLFFPKGAAVSTHCSRSPSWKSTTGTALIARCQMPSGLLHAPTPSVPCAQNRLKWM